MIVGLCEVDKILNRQKYAIIIGAGPAGLTAAYELLSRTDIKPIVLESTSCIGGISRTVDFKGNKIDIGGHRFFSKSSRVTDWWEKMLPHQGPTVETEGLPTPLRGPEPDHTDRVMLVRRRLSRIFFMGKLFPYPLQLNSDLLGHLGWRKVLRIGLDYMMARLRPIRPENSLEDFLKNRFGNHLYQTFFRDYTEKLWGVPCSSINPEWGSQRIKGLSLRKAVAHAIIQSKKDLDQRKIESSLIGHFHYPKFGPGQMWEQVAREIERLGASIIMETSVTGVEYSENRTTKVSAMDKNGKTISFQDPDWVLSSMPIKELFHNHNSTIPPEISEVSQGLLYRDFVTVGILCKRLSPEIGIRKDNWIYIQDPSVNLGRVQIFNNWSPYLVKDSSKIWLGLEYFTSEADNFWNLPDKEIDSIARKELSKIGLVTETDIIESVVIRQPKAYPAYFGSYDKIDKIRSFVDSINNLFLIGRNGMHRYNNQDHSMLSAMTAVDIILDSGRNKNEIWSINTESEYHEK